MCDDPTKWRDNLEQWMKEHYWTPYGYQRWVEGLQQPAETNDAEFWHNFDRALENREMRKARVIIDYDTLDLTADDLALLKGMKIKP
jgi:hypothetical protein